MSRVEEWRPVVGHEGLYEVSSWGRVLNIKMDRMMSGHVLKNGYLYVSLYRGKNLTHQSIHRLVALAFLPKVEGRPQVNHIDEDKLNNYLENLEWVTPADNINYGNHNKCISKKLSMPVKGTNLESGEVITFRSTQEASKLGGFTQPSVVVCCNGKRKSHKGFKWEYI